MWNNRSGFLHNHLYKPHVQILWPMIEWITKLTPGKILTYLSSVLALASPSNACLLILLSWSKSACWGRHSWPCGILLSDQLMFRECKYHKIWNTIWKVKLELVMRSVPALLRHPAGWLLPGPWLGRDKISPSFWQDAGAGMAWRSEAAQAVI